MQVLQTYKPVIIELKSKTAKPITVAAEDRIMLDLTGVEFEHRESGRRRFMPWAEVAEIWQPLD